ncbi:MAG: M20/M25/M40 family metallo-hydrolase [Gemmatimonadetes bacterium]|nr:M20/M25/M40 family metallo-hydrolase [Gemmatimonadota bacterium]
MRTFPLFAALLVAATALQAQPAPSPVQQTARAVFAELLGINTDHDSGSTTVAAQAVARRLLTAGIPAADVQVLGPAGSRNHNLVARIHGTGARKPLLLLAHLDVVTARPGDWTLPPYQLTEKDGFLYGRGTSDIKDGAAILVAAFIQLHKDGVVPDRDVILALTAGEESSADYSGIDWLLKNHRDLVDAEWCWNVDGGDPELLHGARVARTVQASEKVYATFQFEATGAGGHSSLPTKDSPITRLAAALTRLAAYDFPVHLSEVTRGALAAAARHEPPAVAADLRQVTGAKPDAAAVRRLAARSPFYNAQMRTTCVATQLEGGHAENALPQRAVAKVNCRILPEEAAGDFVLRTLTRVVADPSVKVTIAYAPVPSPASPLHPEIMRPLAAVTAKFWPGVPLVPQMETGATDGAILRNGGIPTYGMSPVFLDVDDTRAHGRDERIIAKEFDTGADYALAMLKAFATRD